MAGAVFSTAYRTFLGCLIEARRNAGVTQVEVASRLGKPQSYVSKVERGERRLDVVEFTEWARALRVDPSDLYASYLKRMNGSETLTPRP